MNSPINPSERLLRNLKFGEFTTEVFDTQQEAVAFQGQIKKLHDESGQPAENYRNALANGKWSVIYYLFPTRERTQPNGLAQKHIEMLRTRCELQENLIKDLRCLVSRIPGIITEARLDAKQGKETKYNYDVHSELLNRFIP